MKLMLISYESTNQCINRAVGPALHKWSDSSLNGQSTPLLIHWLVDSSGVNNTPAMSKATFKTLSFQGACALAAHQGHKTDMRTKNALGSGVGPATACWSIGLGDSAPVDMKEVHTHPNMKTTHKQLNAPSKSVGSSSVQFMTVEGICSKSRGIHRAGRDTHISRWASANYKTVSSSCKSFAMPRQQ